MTSRSGEAADDSKRLNELSTRWSLIELAQHGSPDEAQQARQKLATRYAPPLRRYLLGLPWRFDMHAVDDVVQGFVQTRLLSGNLLERSNPQVGRFRALLKTALDNFVRDLLRSRTQTPRPQARGVAGNDRCDDVPEVIDRSPVVDPFDAAWARGLIQSTTEHMRQHCLDSGLESVWLVFQARLLDPILFGSEPPSYEQLALEAGFPNAKNAANKLTTGTRIFRRFFEQAVRAYADDDDDYAVELRQMRDVFATGLSLAEPPSTSDIARSNTSVSTSGSATNGSGLLAKVFDLPHSEPVWTAFELEAVLDEYLSATLSDLLGKPRAAGDSPAYSADSTNSTLLVVLTARATPLADFEAVKNWAKREVATGQLALPPDVVSAIYFAALSAARVHRGQRMTRLSDAALATSLAALVQQVWIPENVRQLFRQCLVCLNGS